MLFFKQRFVFSGNQKALRLRFKQSAFAIFPNNNSKQMKSTSLIYFLAALGIVLLTAYVATEKTGKQEPTFKEVKIGNQIWMAENLRITHFRNGEPIPYIHSGRGSAWENASRADQPAYCYLHFNRSNHDKYGIIYNWYAIFDPRGLAPEGWRIPTEEDWAVLIEYLGGQEVAGAKLKSTTGWENDTNATNQSGFGALPGGFLNFKGQFDRSGIYSLWAVSPSNASSSIVYSLSSGKENITLGRTPRGTGRYVRLIKE